MIEFAVKVANDVSSSIGCRFITVDAKPDAIKFYQNLGFEILKEKSDKPTPMYLDLLLKK